ncbi:S-adenosylmethionine decarboxylase [Paenibacillus sedimenti]|uniref:S-adenosylmethionine decarboxylase n=1 Tax=Paenibacillus sedimenti TaxID=2770274 RepID=A0A926KQX3_9BACL|nr:S-adenosylmethionine decarboxylase [Paenibacillus sedimenti]MBD0381663.1 S-adenosylmethionine decarboxylase [Paenibacillus sedimenti]
MKNKLARKAVVYCIVLFLVIWPIYQMVSMLGGGHEEHDAKHLLYQVSLFQMELLNSYLGEAGKIKDTAELDAAKQALYSTGYTHERLVLAAGGNEYLTSLNSLTQLMQYIQRLQIGGERPLKSEETQTLQEAANQYRAMYGIYEKLMASDGNVVSSQNAKLAELDNALATLIRKKLLQ